MGDLDADPTGNGGATQGGTSVRTPHRGSREAEAVCGDLEAIVRAWCDLESGASTAKASSEKTVAMKKPASRKTAAKKAAVNKPSAKKPAGT
jgi:hypothetical protein